jgi:hypothetical protein
MMVIVVRAHWEHVTFVSPHPKSLSQKERDFELLLLFSPREKGLGDVSVAACSAGLSVQT